MRMLPRSWQRSTRQSVGPLERSQVLASPLPNRTEITERSPRISQTYRDPRTTGGAPNRRPQAATAPGDNIPHALTLHCKVFGGCLMDNGRGKVHNRQSKDDRSPMGDNPRRLEMERRPNPSRDRTSLPMTTSSPTSHPTQPARLAEFLTEARRRVDEALVRFLPDPADEVASGCPARLAEAMRYSLMAGGKRLRPILAMMAAEACGADPAEALPAACALEMVHTYSLIHDDLPAMDDDDLRRGRPTCHKAFDEATAILAGDGLLTLAFEVIAKYTRSPTAAATCVRALAEGAGPSGMVGGQMADLQAEGRADGTVDALEAIHRRKTGALLRSALKMGAAVAGASEPVAKALDDYGRAVGLAFQIVDDLLDVEGDEAKLGKRVQKDSDLGKWTYPGFLGVDGSRSKARQLAEEAIAALAPLGDRGARLKALALDLLERDR
jgi:geranylgeranyl diphosphate synthase, type II